MKTINLHEIARARSGDGALVEVTQQAAVAAMQHRDLNNASYLGRRHERTRADPARFAAITGVAAHGSLVAITATPASAQRVRKVSGSGHSRASKARSSWPAGTSRSACSSAGRAPTWTVAPGPSTACRTVC